MILTDLQLDTVLVTDVAGRMEAAFADKWGLKVRGLAKQIETLRYRGVNRAIIELAHGVRTLRNTVIHHPRTCLVDREKFRSDSEEILPVIERSSGPEDFEMRVRTELGQDIEKLLDAKLKKSFEGLDTWPEVEAGAELDSRLDAAFSVLGGYSKPKG